MTDITEEQWEVLRLRRSQQDLQLLLTALATDGSVTIAGNSEPPPPAEDAEDVPEDAPEPVVTSAQAEAELNALYAELQVAAAEQAEEEAAKAEKEAAKAEKKTEPKSEAKA